MARLPYLPSDALDPDDPDLAARPINLFRILAHSPGALRAWKNMGDWIREGTSIDPRLRELAILEVAVAAGSRYVFSHHVEIGRRFMVTAADAALVATWPDPASQPCTDQENAVLSAARQLSTGGAIDAGTWQMLSSFFTPAQRIDLLMTIGYYTMVTRCGTALELDVEPEYRQFLPPQADRWEPARPGDFCS
ncbi:MAG: carboxymuconolactone decarboxylase family protein [Streptosporangiaceae bacterium]